MIITIITGGSGSEKIQEGLFEILPDLPINLIINGYDDGKSTGILRNLLKNSLGISDFRKNQLIDYKLLYGNDNIYKLLNYRFTLDKNNVLEFLLKKINGIENNNIKSFLKKYTEYFFKLKEIENIDYNDFNYMNIIYYSLLHINNNDIIKVCNIIKEIFKLKNNIYINSNKNLILNAITKNNKILLSEEDIVNFNDLNDKIIDIKYKNDVIPILDNDTENIILKSNIIIMSCGTQFSSLIPTYKTKFFKETLDKSNSKKYLIFNCNYDNDIINYNGNELLNKINEYINIKKNNNIKIVISNDINKNLIPNDINYEYLNIEKLINNNKHDGYILWKNILIDYYYEYFNTNYIFDYDYTLFDNDFYNISLNNIEFLNKINNKLILTNNSYQNLLNIDNTIIYSNFSNIFSYNNISENLDNKYLFNNNDILYINNILKSIKLNEKYIIENKNNISISIKPFLILKEKNEIYNLIYNKLYNSNYNVIKTGNTTIEIVKYNLNKRLYFINNNIINNNNYTYISDLNDINYNILEDKIKFLKINSVYDTNLFLKAISFNTKYDFCIIAGGINKRMNINKPKCLFEINEEIILSNIINNILPYSNNIYICCNNYYKHFFIEFQKKYNTNNIIFLYFNSYDNKQSYPYGNGDTIYQLLNTIKTTNKIFILWSDIIINNNNIFKEIYNIEYEKDFIIPTIYEKDPYAYLIIDDNNNVLDVNYKKNNPISYGYHDQCIFLCNTNKIYNILKMLLYKNKIDNNNELSLLDTIKYIKNIHYYNTKYKIKTFNYINEII